MAITASDARVWLTETAAVAEIYVGWSDINGRMLLTNGLDFTDADVAGLVAVWFGRYRSRSDAEIAWAQRNWR